MTTFFALWFICGFVSVGMDFAQEEGAPEKKLHTSDLLQTLLIGPIGLGLSLKK